MAGRQLVVAGGQYSNIEARDRARIHNRDNITISNTYELHCRRTIAIPPKERIGLTASVCGLKRQADDLFTRVSQHGSTQSQGACMPTLPPSLVHGLVESQTVLAQLETLLQNVARLPQERTSLIRADYLVVTFTEAVVLMSDLEECLKCLDAPRTGALEVDQQGSNLASLSQRLNTQCVIWRTQLDMLQCSSNEEACEISSLSADLVDELLASNSEMRKRMDTFEQVISELAQDPRNLVGTSRYEREDIHTLNGASRLSLNTRDFEQALQNSWVYKRNMNRRESMSFNSSITRDHAWSELSKGLSELTLANLSIISVIALPVKASELTNSSWYQVNITTAVRALQLQTPTSSRKQAFVEEIHGQRVRQLEEEVTRTIRMIQDKRPVEDEEAKAMHLKQTSEIIGRALARFSSNVREDPTSVLSSDLSRSIFELRDAKFSDTRSLLLQRIYSSMNVLRSYKSTKDTTYWSYYLRHKLELEDEPESIPRDNSPLAETSEETSTQLRQVAEIVKNVEDEPSNTLPGATPLCTLTSTTGSLDDRLTIFEGYVTLDLSERALRKLPLDDLRAMTNKVQILILDGNKFSDFSGAQDESLEQLRVLRLCRNGLTTFPEDLIPLSLNIIDVSHNFIDRIPTTICKMQDLRELVVYGNVFEELPAEVWKMESLEKLYVQWTVWRAWCRANQECVYWKVVKRYEEGLYTLGWVELEKERPPPFVP